jgi:ectoine hydroxylase-related dioxygenase (phytanoyl-CoA dioxygenase family)
MPAVRQWLATAAVRRLIEPHLGPSAQAVRGILFDKTPAANWKVAWHQDRSIAVRERRDVAGFGPWSVKDGVVHVQPPAEVLACMLTLRLHLDDCDDTNGPLRVIPGSHRDGILTDAAIAAAVAAGPVVNCCMPAGGVLLMRPLLLHASSAATHPRHRRVLHVEFSPDDLPGGLAWAASG